MGTRASDIDATSSFGLKFRIEIVGGNRIEVAVSSHRNLCFDEEEKMRLSGREMVFHRMKIRTEAANVAEIYEKKIRGVVRTSLWWEARRGVFSGGIYAISSHRGKGKTYKLAQIKYYWTDMRKQIYSHIDNCNVCAERKEHTCAPAPMLNYPIPHKPWERIHSNTLELPLFENGFKYLLVIIDYFSRYCILQPIQNKKAETISTTILEKVICPYTTPKTIITDIGLEFNNAILAEICRIFNIK